MNSNRSCVECLSNLPLGSHYNTKYCKTCSEKVAAQKERASKGISFLGDEITCPVCHKLFRVITSQHIKMHGFSSSDEFKKQFNLNFLASPSKRKSQSDFMSENSPSIKGVSQGTREKISKNRTGKGLGVAGKYIRTSEIRSRISKGVTKHYFNTSYSKSISVTSDKTPKYHFAVRSTWEARVVKILNRHPCVESLKVEPFAIKYFFEGVQRRYLPDFLITLEGNITELWEVKPEYRLTEPKNIAKLAALNDYCNLRGFNSRIVTLDQIEAMEMQVGLRRWVGGGKPWVNPDNISYRPTAKDLDMASLCRTTTAQADFSELEGLIEDLHIRSTQNV